MGKHSGSDKGRGGAGRGENPKTRANSRRVPAERRRTPGERATAGRMHGEESLRIADPSTRRRGSLESAPARLRVERDRRRSRAKRVVLIVAGSVLALLLLVAGAGALFLKNIESTMRGTIVKQAKLANVLTKAKPMEPFNVLILGADYRRGDKKYRTDSMMIAHVDPKTKRVWLISIPRDTRVEVPGHGVQKINAAHFIDGPPGAIKAIENLTGLKINHYLEMNFDGFKLAVDSLGGVWIDVPVAIDDKLADNSPGDRASHIDAGYQQLDGEHALTFMRARHQFVDQDFSRMKNQQLFFKALADQIAKTSSVAKLPGMVSSVAPYIQTDMTLVEMVRTAQALKAAGSANLYAATVKGEWKSPYIYPDEAQLAELVADIKAQRPFEATATVVPASAEVAVLRPALIGVTVRNGSGIVGAAKQASSILEAKGFRIAEVGNANQNVYDSTLIVYKKNRPAAELLASALQPGSKIVESRGMYTFATDLLVVVGKDWDVAKVPVTQVNTQ